MDKIEDNDDCDFIPGLGRAGCAIQTTPEWWSFSTDGGGDIGGGDGLDVDGSPIGDGPTMGEAWLVHAPRTQRGSRNVFVVKAVRELVVCGLKDAFDIMDNAPSCLGLRSSADIQPLRDLGCVVELREVKS